MEELKDLINRQNNLQGIINDSQELLQIVMEAIKNQRWFFFRNKDMIIFDRNTRLLWPNLCEYLLEVDCCDRDSAHDGSYNNSYRVQARKREEITKIVQKKIEKQKLNGYKKWRLPTTEEALNILEDRSFPFIYLRNPPCCYMTEWYVGTKYPDGHVCCQVSNEAEYFKYFKRVSYSQYFRVQNGVLALISYDYSQPLLTFRSSKMDCSCWIICNDTIQKASSSQFEGICLCSDEYCSAMINLFKSYDLEPIFDANEANAAYHELMKLEDYRTELAKINELIVQIEEKQSNKKVVLFSIDEELKRYDLNIIDSSVIRYYQAVQQWTDELLEKLDCYEKEKDDVIRDFNVIGLKLGKKYESNDLLTAKENALLCERQRYFASRFSLGMTSVKSKILAVKHQAEELEYRIDEIDNGEDAIHQLALLEKEERASFGFIAENTAKIIRNALKKIEYFEVNHQYVVWAINAWEEWTEKYKVFKTTYREELRSSCESDSIEEEIWQDWYADWQSLRFKIEQKVQPIIEKELHERIAMIEEDEISVAQQIISELAVYRDAVDSFYLEERKGIYQNFVFQSNGDVQDKLETESKLYKLTAQFQTALQSIIFNCAKAEDRIFILNWANDLLDIQIDDILALVSDNDLDKISDTILTEFSELKKKNYEIYLADAKSYGEEQARRDKQFNSLLFKMRKGLK